VKLALLPLLGLLLMTSGCSVNDEEKLRNWMAEQRLQVKARITPLPIPKPFQPEPYEAANLPDPFGKEKLNMVLRRSASQLESDPLLAPEIKRRKEPLEAFPLDAMTMVGSVSKQGQPMALILADRLLYQVRVGNYMGKNYGRVIKITESELTVREIVQDAAGEWVERPASLQLQEKTK